MYPLRSLNVPLGVHVPQFGNPCAKRSELKHGKLNDGIKDEGIGNWLTINSTDDLFKFNIDLDFEKLGCKPLMINT